MGKMWHGVGHGLTQPWEGPNTQVRACSPAQGVDAENPSTTWYLVGLLPVLFPRS